jgi:hypothetical protein
VLRVAASAFDSILTSADFMPSSAEPTEPTQDYSRAPSVAAAATPSVGTATASGESSVHSSLRSEMYSDSGPVPLTPGSKSLAHLGLEGYVRRASARINRHRPCTFVSGRSHAGPPALICWQVRATLPPVLDQVRPVVERDVAKGLTPERPTAPAFGLCQGPRQIELFKVTEDRASRRGRRCVRLVRPCVRVPVRSCVCACASVGKCTRMCHMHAGLGRRGGGS